MTARSKRHLKALPGERLDQAYVAIRAFEAEGVLWTVPQLARRMGVSVNQCYVIVDALYRKGKLVRGDRTLTHRGVLCIAPESPQPSLQ
jgi:hypothetical protein